MPAQEANALSRLHRRRFLALAAAAIVSGDFLAAQLRPDIVIRIYQINADLGLKHSVRTLAYNGQVPGPLLRMTEGKPVSIEVINESERPDIVHWHGLRIPAAVDGAPEEGTPMVMAQDRRRYMFTPEPAGTRWYHSHAMAALDLSRGTYSGQFGMLIVEPRENPARYDLEVPLLLHEWDPSFSPETHGDIDYTLFTINGKMVGAGEPVRVRRSQRVLFRILNASATLQHRLALAGHEFTVIALDGNPVPRPQRVPVLDLGPGERIDAVVEMTNPGIWTFGETDDLQRAAGAGIVVEYAGATGKPRWSRPVASTWDYTIFGNENPRAAQPDSTIPLVFEPQHDGHLYSINGKLYPNTDPISVRGGTRNRLILDNRSLQPHPLHLHRHSFELVKVAGEASEGVVKDVVVVPAKSIVEVDVTANNPGLSLFHCHQQFHMDFGFMAMMQYIS